MLGSKFFFALFAIAAALVSCDFGSLLHHSKNLNLPSMAIRNLTSSCLGICHSGKFNRDCIFEVFICVKSLPVPLVSYLFRL